MPTPLAHGLAGIAVARTVRNSWRAWHVAALAFFITLAPDFDFIPGVLFGEPGLFHRGPTHSFLGAAVISGGIALLLAMLARAPGDRDRRLARRFLRWYGFVLPVYTAHLILDLVAPHTPHNSGVRLLWPFTDAYMMAPIPVPEALRGFFDLEFGPDSAGFFRTLFSAHAVAVYFVEAVLFSPLLAVPLLAFRLKRRAWSDAAGCEPGEHAAPRHAGGRRAPRPEPAADAAS